jgi:hypothetical protein
MSATGDVDIRTRLRGERETARGIRRVRDEFKGLSRELSFVKSAGAGVSHTFDQLGGAARRASYIGIGGFAAAVGLGAREGLKFNATMEQNTVAFTNFLGSTKAAKRYLGELFELAEAHALSSSRT